MKTNTFSPIGLILLILCLYAAAGDIMVNPSIRYQVIDGFGAHGNGDIGMAVNDLGMTVHRGGCNGGVEDYHRTSYAAAKAQDEEMKLFLSVWTPPGDMKLGPFEPGCVDGAGRCGGTLDPTKYTDFANWIINTAQAYEDAGMKLYAISPQNEPWLSMWYVSCTYSQQQYRDMLRAVGPLVHNRFPDLKIISAEMFLSAANWEKVSFLDDLGEGGASLQCDILARHGYTASGAGVADGSWRTYAALYAYGQIGKPRPVWMTEQSNYNESWDPEDGIYHMACDIYNFLRYGNGSAWIWWLLSGSGGVGGSTEGMMNGSSPKKAYFCMKHFSRYIRPGAERIYTVSDTASDVHAVAFHHQEKNTLAIVVINQNSSVQNCTVKGDGLPSQFDWYLTNGGRDCEKQGTFSNSSSIAIPPKSLVTVFGENYNPAATKAGRPQPAVGARRNKPVRDFAFVEIYDTAGRLAGKTAAGNHAARALVPVRSVYQMVMRDGTNRIIDIERSIKVR